MDHRLAQMITRANQREKAELVNNSVRRGKNGQWEFNLDNLTMIEKFEKFDERYADMYDQGQPYEIAEQMWGGPEKLNKALQAGTASKVEKKRNDVYRMGRIPSWDEVRCE